MFLIFLSRQLLVCVTPLTPVLCALRTLPFLYERASSIKEPGAIHAWPFAALFLSSNSQERLKGVNSIVDMMKRRMK